MNLIIDKGVPIKREKGYKAPADPECYALAKNMEVGDSVLLNDKHRAKKLMQYINRLHPETNSEWGQGGAKSRVDDFGNVRVWRTKYEAKATRSQE